MYTVELPECTRRCGIPFQSHLCSHSWAIDRGCACDNARLTPEGIGIWRGAYVSTEDGFLEGAPEAGGHHVVEDGVDWRAHIEEDNGEVVETLVVNLLQAGWQIPRPKEGKDPNQVKWTPANEETSCDHNWKIIIKLKELAVKFCTTEVRNIFTMVFFIVFFHVLKTKVTWYFHIVLWKKNFFNLTWIYRAHNT